MRPGLDPRALRDDCQALGIAASSGWASSDHPPKALSAGWCMSGWVRPQATSWLSAVASDQKAAELVNASGAFQIWTESGQSRRESASSSTSPGCRTRSGSVQRPLPWVNVQPTARQAESAVTRSSTKSPGADCQLTWGSGSTRISVTATSPGRAAARGCRICGAAAANDKGPQRTLRVRVAVTVAPKRTSPKASALESALPQAEPLSSSIPRVSQRTHASRWPAAESQVHDQSTTEAGRSSKPEGLAASSSPSERRVSRNWSLLRPNSRR